MGKIVNYIKYRKNIFILFLIVMIIFAVVYFSYNIGKETYLYAFFLSLVVAGAWAINDYYKINKKIDYIKILDEQADEDLLENLAKDDFIIQEYNQVIKKLTFSMNEMDSKKNQEIRDLEEFFIMWTHQIKLPISAINLYLDSNNQLNKSILKGQVKRIQQYTDMVMAYIRLKSDQSDFLFSEVDLDLMIKNVIKEFKLDFINKRLDLDFKPLNKKILTDKKWFEFALGQILSNALKYTKEGGVKIYITGDDLVVEDTGMGIKPEDIKRVFDKGYTGYNGRDHTGASGLGLFLVKKTLSSLSHSIRIESEINKGTKVFIGLYRYDFKAE